MFVRHLRRNGSTASNTERKGREQIQARRRIHRMVLTDASPEGKSWRASGTVVCHLRKEVEFIESEAYEPQELGCHPFFSDAFYPDVSPLFRPDAFIRGLCTHEN
jgi:hypothetical protein